VLQCYELWILVISTISALAAFVAAAVGLRESRRNNTVVLSIRRCSSSEVVSRDENELRPFAQLTLILRNHGLPLYGPRVWLTWVPKPGYGPCSFALERCDAARFSRGPLLKGMVAEFGLKSYELDAMRLEFLAELQDPRRQRARFCVHSQGYLATEFWIGGLRDKLKGRWNAFAFRVNRLCKTRVWQNDQGVRRVKTPRILPTVTSLEFQLKEFLRILRYDLKQASEDQAGGKCTQMEGDGT
jgi:hypothetical protein